MTSIENPHDKYFKKSMSNINVATEFFQSHLPAEMLKMVDLATLEQQKESLIDTNLSNPLCASDSETKT